MQAFFFYQIWETPPTLPGIRFFSRSITQILQLWRTDGSKPSFVSKPHLALVCIWLDCLNAGCRTGLSHTQDLCPSAQRSPTTTSLLHATHPWSHRACQSLSPGFLIKMPWEQFTQSRWEILPPTHCLSTVPIVWQGRKCFPDSKTVVRGPLTRACLVAYCICSGCVNMRNLNSLANRPSEF